MLGYEPVYVHLELLHWGTQALQKSRRGIYRVTGEQSQRDWKVVLVPRSIDSKSKALKETLLRRRKDWKPPLFHLLSPGGVCLGKFPVPWLRPLGCPLYRCFKLGHLACGANICPIPSLPRAAAT